MLIGMQPHYLENAQTHRHTYSGNIKHFPTILDNLNKNTVFRKNMISFKN